MRKHKQTYNYSCPTLEDLDRAQRRKKEATPGVEVNIFLVCRKDNLRMLPHEKKVAIVDQGIYCQSHALAVARETEPSLQEAEFEDRLIRCKGSGAHNLFIYYAVNLVLTAH